MDVNLSFGNVADTLNDAINKAFDAVVVTGTKDGITSLLVGVNPAQPAAEPIPEPVPTVVSYDALVAGYDAYDHLSDTGFPVAGLAVGESYVNPHYGTTVTRAWDSALVDNPGNALGPVYTRVQSYNQDGTRVLLLADNGWWHLLTRDDDDKFSTPKRLTTSPNPAGDCELNWHPIDPDVVRYTARYGSLIYRELNVVTDTLTVYFDLTAVNSVNGDSNIKSITDVFPTASRAWMKGEGSPSADHKWWGFQVEDANFNFLGLATYNTETGELFTLDTTQYASQRPDHCSMSVSGNFFVPSSDQAGVGTRAYTNDLSSFIQVHHKSDHSDLAIMPNGDDVYVACNFQDNEGNFFFHNLVTDVKTELTNLFSYPFSDPNHIKPFHVSGRCFDNPGWVMFSTYGTDESAPSWSKNKIWMYNLETQEIRVISNTYNRYTGYFTAALGPISRRGDKVMLGIVWGEGATVQPYEFAIV